MQHPGTRTARTARRPASALTGFSFFRAAAGALLSAGGTVALMTILPMLGLMAAPGAMAIATVPIMVAILGGVYGGFSGGHRPAALAAG